MLLKQQETGYDDGVVNVPAPLLNPLMLLQQYGLLVPKMVEIVKLLGHEASYGALRRRLLISTLSMLWYSQRLRLKLSQGIDGDRMLWGTITMGQAWMVCDAAHDAAVGGDDRKVGKAVTTQQESVLVVPFFPHPDGHLIEATRLAGLPLPLLLVSTLSSSGCIRQGGGEKDDEDDKAVQLVTGLLKSVLIILENYRGMVGLEACRSAMAFYDRWMGMLLSRVKVSSEPALSAAVKDIINHPVVQGGGWVPSSSGALVGFGWEAQEKSRCVCVNDLVALIVKHVSHHEQTTISSDLWQRAVTASEDHGKKEDHPIRSRLRKLMFLVVKDGAVDQRAEGYSGLSVRLKEVAEEVKKLGIALPSIKEEDFGGRGAVDGGKKLIKGKARRAPTVEVSQTRAVSKRLKKTISKA